MPLMIYDDLTKLEAAMIKGKKLNFYSGLNVECTKE